MTHPSDRPITITPYNHIPPDQAKLVDAGLGEANVAAAPLELVQPLSCFAQDAAGETIGGAVGRTWGVCCELLQLWVHPDHRRQGIGWRLVEQFHATAEARGCRTFILDTFSFQAPDFYQSLGYEKRVVMQGFPDDIEKYVMVREIVATE